jgi:hypothetical protein
LSFWVTWRLGCCTTVIMLCTLVQCMFVKIEWQRKVLPLYYLCLLLVEGIPPNNMQPANQRENQTMTCSTCPRGGSHAFTINWDCITFIHHRSLLVTSFSSSSSLSSMHTSPPFI